MMRWWMVVGAATALLSLQSAWAGELDSALAAVERVGPKGAGAEAAASGWKKLAQADASQIPLLLAAIDEDNPLAANWIRSAVETIAQRESDDLPADALEQFVKQTDHNPRARRLAYELLLRVDPQAKSRLLPKMLHDPSVELRRDAVAWKMNREFQSREKQIENLRAAFAAAVDDDQVKELAQRLKDLGEQVDLARHYGFVMKWHLIGPFDNADEKGFHKSLGPEGKPIDLSASDQGSHGQGEVAWREVVSDDDYGRIDLNEELGKHKSAVAYAVAFFHSDEARPVELRYKSKNACKVWLNGTLIDEREVYHSDGNPSMDQYTCQGELEKGRNTILIKVCQNDQPESWAQSWAFQLRVCDSAGAAVLAENRVEKSSSDAPQKRQNQ